VTNKDFDGTLDQNDARFSKPYLFEADPTEDARRALVSEINEHPTGRVALEAKHGQVWDTIELQRDYTVEGFCAPFVSITRKADGQRGTLMFQHAPRFYFDFSPH